MNHEPDMWPSKCEVIGRTSPSWTETGHSHGLNPSCIFWQWARRRWADLCWKGSPGRTCSLQKVIHILQMDWAWVWRLGLWAASKPQYSARQLNGLDMDRLPTGSWTPLPAIQVAKRSIALIFYSSPIISCERHWFDVPILTDHLNFDFLKSLLIRFPYFHSLVSLN